MNELISLFLNNLLPIYLIAGAGYLLGRRVEVDPRSISRVIFYVFSPCLIFNLITRSQLNSLDVLRMSGGAALITLLVGMITWAAGLALKLQRPLLMAALLSTMFMNAGNFGLPLTLLAFGDKALAQASIFFVATAVLTYSLGVVIASMGTTGLFAAIGNLFKVPMIYTLALGMLNNQLKFELPLPVYRMVGLLGDAAIPAMLLLLGLQLQRANWKANTRALFLVNAVRLLVAPALAYGLCASTGFTLPARQAFVLESAMPSAVTTTMLATEYNVQPAFVTAAVFTSTLLSPLTLTPLLAFLS